MAELGLIPHKSCSKIAEKVNDYLLQWRQERKSDQSIITLAGYRSDSYIVDAECPRFGSGEGKGVISDSVTSWTFRSLTKQVLGLCMSGMGDFDSYRFKVVGNIHDNPEMVQQVSLTIPERKPRRNSGKVKIEFVTKGATISTNVSQETAQALVEEMSRHS